MHYKTTMMLAGLLGALALNTPAAAQTTPAAQGTAAAAPGAAGKTVEPAWPKAAASDKLDGLRGGADTDTTQASLNATVAGNSARNVVTGNNVIDNGSFANMSGLPMVIQNTGANVLIQNATVINLQMR
ncbi:MAG: hypothetical protein JWP59_4174 [Massilia sp.]|nr:hypothetical protein [Massilia sp.]